EGAGAQLFLQAEELLASERYGEAEAEARRAAQSFRDAGSTEGAVDAVRVVVKSLLGQGRRVEALAFAQEEKENSEDRTAVAKLSVSVAEASLGDAGSQAQAKAGLQEARGDGDLAGLEMGLRHAGEAKQMALELGNRRLEAMSLLLMVDGKGMMASPEDALEVADELLDLALELKDKRLEACTLRKLSAWNGKLGDRDRAISDAEEAWEIYCDLESPQEPQALRALVEGLLPVDPRRARRLCTESLSRLRQKGQKLAEVEVVRLLVEVLLRLGRLQEAASAAQDCIPICKEIGATEAQAALIVRLARARLQAGDFEKAKTMAENAWTMLDEAKATAQAEKADAMEVLCDAQVQSTDLEDALARATDFREHFAMAGDARGQARALLRCAQLELEMGDYETAFQSAKKACNLYHQERQKREEADAKLLCGKIFWRKADHKAAVTWAERARAAYRELEQTEDEVACLCVISENAARLAAREGASLDASEPAPRAARDALEKSLKSAEAGLKLLKVHTAAPELHGQLLCARAQALTFQGRFLEALGSLDEAVLRFRELDEYGLEANALLLACDNLFALNRAREAAEAATEALTLYQHCQDLEGEERARVLLKHPSLIATARPSEPRPGAPGPIPGADATPVWLQQADAPVEEAAPVAARAVQRSTGPALDMASITPEAVMAKVRDIVSAVTGTELEEIDTETPLMEAGLTSSSAIVMQETLSKELGMKLPMTLVFDYPTIADMAEMVQEQTSQKAIKANLPGRRRWISDLPDLGDLDRIGLDSSDEEDEKGDRWLHPRRVRTRHGRKLRHATTRAATSSSVDCHICALDEQRRVWLWATCRDSHDYQQKEVLEKGAEPPLVLAGCLQVASGAVTLVAPSGHNQVFAWGSNATGQLELQDACGFSDRSLAEQVQLQAVPTLRSASWIGGGLHSTAALVGGRMNSWGKAEDPPVLRPRDLEGLSRSRVRALYCGAHHMLASTEGGDLFVWGCGLTHGLANRPRDVSSPTDADEEPTDELRPYQVSSEQRQKRFVIVAGGGAQHSVDLAWGGEYSSGDPASETPMKRRTTEKEVADDAGMLILAPGTSAAYMMAGFGFGASSGSSPACGAGTAGSVIDEIMVPPQENSFAGFPNLDDGKSQCDTCSLRWDGTTIQCKACESYKPGFSEEDVAKIEAEKEAHRASTVAMFRSSSDAQPTGWFWGWGQHKWHAFWHRHGCVSGFRVRRTHSGAIWLRWHICRFCGWLWQWLLQRLRQQLWPERQQHGCCHMRFRKVVIGDVFVHGSGECDQLGLGDDMRERKKPTLLNSLFGQSICEVAGPHHRCSPSCTQPPLWKDKERAPSDGSDGGPSDVEPHPVTMPCGVAVRHVSCRDCCSFALDEM
ncbi:HERC2, partial [Symbiodinium necroappetens]